VQRQSFRLSGQLPAYLAEQEMAFDIGWRLLRARQWTWGPHDPNNRDGPKQLAYGGEGLDLARFYAGAATGGNWWAARLPTGEVAVMRDGKMLRCLPAQEDVAPEDVVDLLLCVAPEAVAHEDVRSWRWQDGSTGGDCDFGQSAHSRATLNDRPAIQFGAPQWERTIAPSTGEYAHRLRQAATSFRLTTEEAYREALRGFLADFGIEKLSDDKGNPVDLPLGTKGLVPPRALVVPAPRRGPLPPISFPKTQAEIHALVEKLRKEGTLSDYLAGPSFRDGFRQAVREAFRAEGAGSPAKE
jgi:hypothetical protein